MSDLTVSGPETVAPAAAPAPAAPVVPAAPARPSLFRRALHRLSVIESKVIHDPLVTKEGKALVLAVAVRALLAAGASDGAVQLARTVLHSAGV